MQMLLVGIGEVVRHQGWFQTRPGYEPCRGGCLHHAGRGVYPMESQGWWMIGFPMVQLNVKLKKEHHDRP